MAVLQILEYFRLRFNFNLNSSKVIRVSGAF